MTPVVVTLLEFCHRQQEQIQAPKVLNSEAAWQATLHELAISDARHIRIATEGALLGTVVDQGTASDLAIISDDAEQFDVLPHASVLDSCRASGDQTAWLQRCTARGSSGICVRIGLK